MISTQHHCPRCSEEYDLDWKDQEELNLERNSSWLLFEAVCPICIEKEIDINCFYLPCV
jgi:hypothetical protein